MQSEQNELLLVVIKTTESSSLQSGTSFTVRGEAILGRSIESNVHLQDRTISRRHARVFEDENCWWVENLTAHNGVFIDETSVASGQRQLLSNNASLQIGGVLFTVQLLQETIPVTKAMEMSTSSSVTQGTQQRAPFLKIVRDGDYCTVSCKGRFVPMKPSASLALFALASNPAQVVHTWDIQEIMGSSYNLPQALSEVRRSLLALLKEGWIDIDELRTLFVEVAGGSRDELEAMEAAALARQIIVARRGHGYILRLPPSAVDIDEEG